MALRCCSSGVEGLNCVNKITATILISSSLMSIASGSTPHLANNSIFTSTGKPLIEFARDIQPILAEKCYSCHGPEKQKSGLRLDRKADALAGGDNGKAIIPGKSAESLLLKNVLGQNPET